MKPSQLLLEAYFFEQVAVTAHALADADEVAAPVIEARRFYIPHSADRNRWQVRLEVDLAADDGKPTGYTGLIVLRGDFRVEASVDRQMVDFLITNGAPALLYGAAREMLLTITSRGPHQAVMLPSVIFHPEELPGGPVSVASDAADEAKPKRVRKAGKKV